MKKYLWCLLTLTSVRVSASTLPTATLIDSLRLACESQTDAQKRVDILLNLKDLTDSSDDEMLYTRKLYEEALAVGDAFAVGASLGSLASCYIGKPGDPDSRSRRNRAVRSRWILLIKRAPGLLSVSLPNSPMLCAPNHFLEV